METTANLNVEMIDIVFKYDIELKRTDLNEIYLLGGGRNPLRLCQHAEIYRRSTDRAGIKIR